MRITSRLKLGAVGAALVGGLCVVSTGQAQAATPDGIASIGSATISMAGSANQLTAVAQCNVDDRATNSTAGPSIAGVVSFGAGTTRCLKNLAHNTTTSTAIGTRFQLDALDQAGGPRIRIANYQVTCSATTEGTSASWQFSGLTGLGVLPRHIPSNYSVSIRGDTGQVVAKVIFNEVTLSHPNDGSITLNLLHIKLLPTSGLSGDVIVGATACSPTF
jgi:hypothetical protein